MQRQPDDVALVAEAFHAVHQLPHQKESAPLLPGEVLIGGAIDCALIEIEPWTFIHYFENEIGVADDGADADLLAARSAVSAQDRIR